MTAKGLGRYLADAPGWRPRGSTSNAAALASLEGQIGPIPPDHRDVLASTNGGTFKGPRDSIHFHRMEDVMSDHDEHAESIPGLIVFADNGSGALYAYDPDGHLGRGRWAVYWIHMSSLSPDWARFAGATVTDVVQRIADGVSFFDEPTLRD